MKSYKVEINDTNMKDSEPEVGIFAIIDNEPKIISRPVNLAKAAREGVDDAGDLWHNDLIRNCVAKASDTEKKKWELAKSKSRNEPYLFYSRGRVIYNYNNDLYVLYISPSMVNDPKTISKLLQEFRLPANKRKIYGDYSYEPYDL